MASYVFKSPLEETICMPVKVSACKWSKDSPNVGHQSSPSPHTRWDWKPKSRKILPNIMEAVGNTPMVRLNKIPAAEGIECDLYAKCEFLNPAGSVKDRMVFRVIEDAEKSGVLKPGGTLIDASSGNTGIGLAWACAVKGYKCVIVLPDKFSKEKERIIRALGGEVVRARMNIAPDTPEGFYGLVHLLHKKIPNSLILDQFSNPANPLIHYDTTAEEIFDQCDGQVDMIVLGCGTGGTMAGVSRKFKEISPQTIIIGADPYGSTYAQPESINKTDCRFFEIEGIGYEILPTVCDRSMVTKWYKFGDKEPLNMARRLIKEEGLLVGTTSGLLLAGALKAIKEFKMGKGKKVVILLPDGMKNYLTKFVVDQWMEQRGLIDCLNTQNHWWWDIKVTELDYTHCKNVTSNQTLEQVLADMDRFSVDYLPVTVENGHVLGVAVKRNIMNKLISGEGGSSDKITVCLEWMYSKLPISSNLGLVSRVLEIEPYVLIINYEDGIDNLIGTLMAEDVLRIIRTKK